MKTLAYDLMTLYPPKPFSIVGEGLEIANRTPYPTVTFPKEVILKYVNNYKVLLEFAMEITGKDKDLSPIDLHVFLSKREARKSKRGTR